MDELTDLRLVRTEEQDEELIELGPDEASLDFLQKVYRSPRQPLSTRMRAAALALPFESPKLTAVAVMSGDGFSEMLERAIARSQAPLKQIEHREVELPPAPPPGIRGRSGSR